MSVVSSAFAVPPPCGTLTKLLLLALIALRLFIPLEASSAQRSYFLSLGSNLPISGAEKLAQRLSEFNVTLVASNFSDFEALPAHATLIAIGNTTATKLIVSDAEVLKLAAEGYIVRSSKLPNSTDKWLFVGIILQQAACC